MTTPPVMAGNEVGPEMPETPPGATRGLTHDGDASIGNEAVEFVAGFDAGLVALTGGVICRPALTLGIVRHPGGARPMMHEDARRCAPCTVHRKSATDETLRKETMR